MNRRGFQKTCSKTRRVQIMLAHKNPAKRQKNMGLSSSIIHRSQNTRTGSMAHAHTFHTLANKYPNTLAYHTHATQHSPL